MFTPEGFIERYNFDLCNDLSNLVNRTISMVNKYFDGKIENYTGQINEVDKEFEEYTLEQINKFTTKIDNYEIANALHEIWQIISRTNKYIDETSPWILVKEEKKVELKSSMYHLIENLRKIAILITPFLESTANNIFKQIGIKDSTLKTLESLYNYDMLNDITVISKGEPIFMRLDVEKETSYLKELMKAK